MTSQSIVAVVLPAGPAAGGGLRANIYLTPRLSGGQRLSQFPDWLDWTARVSQHGLRFTLSSGTATATVAADTSLLRPDVWNAIFGHDSYVGDYPQTDFGQRLIVSYPSRQVTDFLRYAYQSAAQVTDPDQAQRVLSDVLEGLSFRYEDGTPYLQHALSQLRVTLWYEQNPPLLQAADAQAASARTAGAPPSPQPPLTPPTGVQDMAARFALYHSLPPAPGRPPLPQSSSELARLIDFHQALTSIAAHSSLLTATGLVLPVELPGSLCPASPAGQSYLTVQVSAVHPGWAWATPPTIATPATAYVRDAAVFTSAPASSPATLAGGGADAGDVIDGFLALTAADYELVGVDIDGALLQAMALADSLANAAANPNPNDPGLSDGLLSALRSSGLSLLADQRAAQLQQAIENNEVFAEALAGTTVPPLTARDLTRGFRLDVYSDRTQAWHSLHRRDGRYVLGHGAVVLPVEDEEGFTQLAVTQPADDPTRPPDPTATQYGIPQPGTDLYLNERIARWNGWSLSAPRPGTPLNRSPDPTQALNPDPTMGESVTSFAMTSWFTAHPGSLPTLRFGARYRMRARAVDLAGQSVPPTTVVADSAALPADGELLPYYRYEPVPHPTLVPRATPGPGASLAQLVIRSHNSDPSLDNVPAGDTDERHVAPPKTSVLMVERHGLLDNPQGGLRGDAATYQLIVERDRGTIPQAGGEPIEPGRQLAIPYFADPLARGAAFADLPQTADNSAGAVAGGVLGYRAGSTVDPRAGSITHVPFGGTWPDRTAFRIRLAEGSQAPAWDEANRVLTVLLPKGQTAQTALSCYVNPEDLDLLGVWDWLRALFEQSEEYQLYEQQNAGAGAAIVGLTTPRGQLTRLVLDGSNEFITPSLPVTLTHAVQQPLGRPTWTRLPIVHNPASPVDAAYLSNSFSPLTAWRSLGSHHAVLLGALAISGATTAAIDVEARWMEWNDDVSEPGPTRTQSSSHLERIQLSSLAGGMIAADGIPGGRTVAVYVPPIDALWFAAPFDQLDGVLSPTQLAAPFHQFDDTRHRMVRYRAVSSSRFQEYFPEPGTVTSRVGPSVTVDVPSSARPVPPDIAYVVPTFGWDRQATTNAKTEVRKGNGLRVYLRRPWYSSGPGELLGVVLWPAAQTGQGQPTDQQRAASKALITQWGLDPLWESGPLAAIPAASLFPSAVRTAARLTLEESAQEVDVAGHVVGYDQDRQLWYCDITVDNPTAYAPFIRLALARYQPHSIPGVELSHVALADFAQLAPDRSAALTVDPADPLSARLVVAGLAPDGPTSSHITATVEARQADVLTDLGWQPAAPADVQVRVDSPAPAQPESVLFAAVVRFARRPPPGQFRLVVREYEILPVDPPLATVSDKPEFGSRLVYASILPFDYPLVVDVDESQG